MDPGATFVEREIDLPTAQLKVKRFDWREPVDGVVFNDERSFLDMCLTPRPQHARGNYLGRFQDSHFEPLGQLMFVPAGLPLRARAGSGRQWALQCWLEPQPFEDLAFSWDAERLRETLHVANARLQATCARLVAELVEPGFASPVVIEGLCAVMAVDLVRHFAEVRRRPPERRGGLPGWRMRRVEERIRADGRPPTLHELARLCAMSPRHLTRAFRQQTGSSLGDHILRVRLARAEELLADDDLSLKEISDRLGFSHAAAFSTAFRRATGERPSDVRARMTAERQPVFLAVSRKPVL